MHCVLPRSLATVSDFIVAGAFPRPSVLISGLQHGRPSLAQLHKLLALTVTGLAAEPLSWLQQLIYSQRLQQLQIPEDPVVVIGHWRSGTTYLHQLMGCDPCAATASNSLTVAPQVALLLKPLLQPLLHRTMTPIRPIDAVPWGADDPQEDEVGLSRLTMDSHMAGIAFPCDYLHHLRRTVLRTTPAYERALVMFCRLTWLHAGFGKHHLLIKNPAHSARVPLLLRLFPRCRFILLKRRPIDAVRSLVLVKQRLASLVGLQDPPDQITQVEETVAAHRLLMEAFEASRQLIPAGQLTEVAFDDLRDAPVATVKRIYTDLAIDSWAQAQEPIARRAAQSRRYRPWPVTLEPAAEQHLITLLGHG